MAEGTDTINPVTEAGGIYPIMPKGKKTHGNEFINSETIEKIFNDMKKRFRMV